MVLPLYAWVVEKLSRWLLTDELKKSYFNNLSINILRRSFQKGIW